VKITRPCISNVAERCCNLQYLGLASSSCGETNSDFEYSLSDEDDIATMITGESIIEIAEVWHNSHCLHIKYYSYLDDDDAIEITGQCPNVDISFYHDTNR